MDGKHFDEIVQTLSATPSRRRMLGGLVGALLGGVLGVRETGARKKRRGRAHAGKGRQKRRKARARNQNVQAQGNPNQGNAECAHFCNDAFPPGPGRGTCKSQAAQGGGLCYECGPAAEDPAAVACQDKDCGEVVNACGDTVSCGECAAPETCGGGGEANVCGSPPCTPTTCEAEGKKCGEIPDGCDGTLDCGGCPGPDTCGGGGEANVCGCTPDNDAACAGRDCGDVVNTCAQTVSCGTCPGGSDCEDGVCQAATEFCIRPGFEHLPRCESYPTTEGPAVSVDRCFNCFELPPCNNSLECGPGHVCVTDPDDVRCGRNACYPMCESPGGGAGTCPDGAFGYCQGFRDNFRCPNDSDEFCTCVLSPEETNECVLWEGGFNCSPVGDPECDSSADCGPGRYCAIVTECCAFEARVCRNACP